MRLRFIAAILSMALSGASAAVTQASDLGDQNRWGFGSDLGFVSGTVNGTVFALNFSVDYYVDSAFSIGPMFQFTPVGDLTRIAMAGVARYHFTTRYVNIVPFAGLGIVHDDFGSGSGPTRIDRNDTSHWIPIGVSLEYPMSRRLALATTLMVNLHDLNLSPPVGEDHTSVSLLFGIHFGP